MKTFSSSSPASLLGLATLALLGLAAAPAHAQTLSLNSGDNLTVSGAGTVGTQNGKAVSNTTSFYSSSGGFYSPAVQTNGTSTFTLANGGSITSSGVGGIALYNRGSGAVTISGGTISSTGFRGAGLYNDYFGGPATISGGTFSPGPGGVGLYNTGILNLFSFNDTPFLVNGVSMNNMTLDNRMYQNGTNTIPTISAILENGDVLNTTFLDSGAINLNIGTPPPAVPEASTTVSLGLLLALGVGGIAFAARRKSAV